MMDNKSEAILTCGRFESVTQARSQSELIDAIDDNIDALNAIIRESVRTVAKYTKQRTALERLKRNIE